MKRIPTFISYPFSSNPEKNRQDADKICRQILKTHKDILPISPLHLFSYMETDDERENIMNVCYKLIEICPDFWSYGKSDGCQAELAYATHIHRKIVDKT